MRIKLIMPRSTIRAVDSAWKPYMAPPLSLLTLAALTPPEHTVTVHDENVERLPLDDRPDLVGITVKVDTVYRAEAITRHYQRRGVPVVWGGIHPTACPESCGAVADAVVLGEAEGLWEIVLTDVAAGRLRRHYRHDAPVDIARAPTPKWEAGHVQRYLFTNTLCIGRGCPWHCDFCYNSAPHVDRRYRMKPIRHILRDLASLGTRHVMFIDDNFIGDPRQTRVLLNALKSLNLTWHTAVSADIGRHEALLDLMAESGCKSLFIGFESIQERNLRCCHKAQNRVAHYDDTIARIHARGIMVNASLVFGFDEDDTDVFAATLAWLVRHRIATMTAHILTPYPGTRLYRQLHDEDRIIDHDLSHYNTAHAVFIPKRMLPEELEAGYRRMYQDFYAWSNIIRRWPTAPGQVAAYLEFNLFYRKFSRLTCALGRLVGMRRLARLAAWVAYPGRRTRGMAAPTVLPVMRPSSA